MMSNVRTLIVAGDRSQVRIVESYAGLQGGAYFTNAVTELFAGEGAVVDHYKVQQESSRRSTWPACTCMRRATRRSRRTRSRSAERSFATTSRRARRRRRRVHAERPLPGRRRAPRRQSHGHRSREAALPAATRSTRASSAARRGRSSTARSSSARTRRRPTRSRPIARCCLSDDATINTKPQLEIFADDVKCTHGAAIGQLDDDAIFYLRARGSDVRRGARHADPRVRRRDPRPRADRAAARRARRRSCTRSWRRTSRRLTRHDTRSRFRPRQTRRTASTCRGAARFSDPAENGARQAARVSRQRRHEQKPQAVIDAMDDYYRHDNANVHRGVAPAERAGDRRCTKARARRRAAFLNAPDAHEIVFTRRHDRGHQSRGAELRPAGAAAGRRDRRLVRSSTTRTSCRGSCSASRPARALRVVPIDDRGELDLDAVRSELLGRARGSSRSAHVSNALGTINPVREIDRAGARAGRRRCWSTARRPCRTCAVDVQALDCDFYAFSGHKMFGPTGIGVLYGSGRAARRDAAVSGRRRHDRARSPSRRRYYNALPYKFEAGTPNIAGVVGLGAAIDYLTAIDLRAALAHEDDAAGVRDGARARDPGRADHRRGARRRPACCRSCSKACTRTTSAPFSIAKGVAVRTGQHCAQPVMDRFGVPATVRASLGHLQHARGDRRARRARCDNVREVFGLMSDLSELYQEVILDHNKRPRNFRAIDRPATTPRATTRSAAIG